MSSWMHFWCANTYPVYGGGSNSNLPSLEVPLLSTPARASNMTGRGRNTTALLLSRWRRPLPLLDVGIPLVFPHLVFRRCHMPHQTFHTLAQSVAVSMLVAQVASVSTLLPMTLDDEPPSQSERPDIDDFNLLTSVSVVLPVNSCFLFYLP